MTGLEFRDLGLRATTTGASCACGSPGGHTHAAAPTSAEPVPIDSTATGVSAQFMVEGMTCSHCVSSVTEEVSAIDGVSRVEVDLHPGGVSTLTVSSAAGVDAGRVREAVEEAGYSMAAVS